MRPVVERREGEGMQEWGWRCGLAHGTPGAMSAGRTGQPRSASSNHDWRQGVRSARFIGRDGRDETYCAAVASVLGLPHMRAMRRGIQETYGVAMQTDRRAAACQRAAVRGAGQISCIGRDRGVVLQGEADRLAEGVSEDWATYDRLSAAYQQERDRLMTARGLTA